MKTVFARFFEEFRLEMPRTKFRSLRRSVTRGKRSRKPKDEPNSKKEKTPSAKKLRLEDDSSSQASSKESYNRPNGYRFQDVDILRRVILACAVCKECFQGTLQLFEEVSGCGLARTLVLQCSNNDCKTFTELPTSERIIRGKSHFYDMNRRSASIRIWNHYASTEDTPLHDYCPEGPDSWCKWQCDQANGTNTFSPKNVAPAVMQEILPTFEALWDRNLLQSVLEGLSQNNNEALNHLVWDISPKKLFAGPETVLTACAIAVCLFNGVLEQSKQC